MIGVQDLRKGTTFTEDNELFRVLDYQHIKSGRGNATIRVKVRNVRSGSTMEKTYPSGSRVQDVRLDHSEVQYLYHDGDLYTFMNVETYEQPVLAADMLGDAVHFLVDNMVVDLETYEGENDQRRTADHGRSGSHADGSRLCRRYRDQRDQARDRGDRATRCRCRCS